MFLWKNTTRRKKLNNRRIRHGVQQKTLEIFYYFIPIVKMPFLSLSLSLIAVAAVILCCPEVKVNANNASGPIYLDII